MAPVSVIVASSPRVHPAEYGLFPLHWCPFRSFEIICFLFPILMAAVLLWVGKVQSSTATLLGVFVFRIPWLHNMSWLMSPYESLAQVMRSCDAFLLKWCFKEVPLCKIEHHLVVRK